jgi:hypothetical protein
VLSPSRHARKLHLVEVVAVFPFFLFHV